MANTNEVVVEVIDPEAEERKRKIKKFAKFGVAALAGLAGGFLLGWYSHPDTVTVDAPVVPEVPFEPDTNVEVGNF